MLSSVVPDGEVAVELDSSTILVAASAALAVLSISLVYFWNRDRRSTWLLWWSVPLLVAAASAPWFTRPDWETNVLGIMVGNGLRILAVGMLWQGARVFEGRRPVWPGLFAFPLAWFLLCLVPGTVEHLPVRVVAVSSFNAVLLALTAWELWRGRAERLPSRWPLMGVMISLAIVMVARAVGVQWMPFPLGALPPEPNWVAGFFLVIFAHGSFSALLLVALTKERHEFTQRRMALVDPLTGLMNRRALDDRTGVADPHDPMPPLAVLALDLDHFKSVNDRYGHGIGDRMLADFATVAAEMVRPEDRLYRMGGEEFCVVLPNADAGTALAVAERIRKAFERNRTRHADIGIGATVSIGAAVAEHPGVPVDVVLAAADTALYEAKSRGRNCTVFADPALLARKADGVVQGRRPDSRSTGT